MKRNIFSILLCFGSWVIFNSSSCRRCESQEPSFKVTFLDFESQQEVFPEFESVTAITVDANLNFNQERLLPLNLNADSVTYIFTSGTNETRYDTLSFVYDRELIYGARSYCMDFDNISIEHSTFRLEDYSTTTYEIILYY